MTATVCAVVDSPVGELLLVGDGDALSGLWMREGRRPVSIEAPRDDCTFADARTQLGEYFAGDRERFDLPLALSGSPFQLRVWEELQAISYGTTITYGELAARVARPGAARAVGLANGSNPVSIVVPCHRVIGADGTLTGYGGGLERKRRLLELESGVLSPARASS